MGKPRAGAPTPHDRTVLFAMVRLVNLTARPFQEGLGRAHRLGLSEWRTLAAVHDRPGAAATEIALHTGLDKMTVSRALASLERSGRLVRRPDPSDGRRALASLTPAGRRLFTAVREQARRREAVVTAPLSDAERQRLRDMLERMTASVLSADAAGDRDR